MGLMDFLKKKENNQIDPLSDLVLSKLKTGYMLDYDLKTWKVTGYFKYDFGEGYTAEEWELTSGNDKYFLGREEDDDVEWTLSNKVPMGALEGDVRKHIIDNEDPPDKVTYKEKIYYLDESGTGKMYENGKPPAKEFIYWDLIDEEDEHFLSIEQWDETEFEASQGFYVEEYQFTNILPGADE